MSRPSPLLAAALAALLAGCYRTRETGVVISGHVAIEGKPVSDATISFVPDVDKSGRGGGSLITNGRYTVTSDAGLIPGEFNVLVFPATPVAGSPPTTDAPKIPGRYQKMNELRVTVPERKSYSFDFDLKPDPPPPAIESPKGVD